MTTRIVVTNCDTIANELNLLRGTSGLSWSQIAKLPRFEGIPRGTLCRIAKGGYEPQKTEMRQRLGLPPISSVTPVEGEIPGGSLSIGARQCECGRWFISNSPRRNKCFICSPYRGGKGK